MSFGEEKQALSTKLRTHQKPLKTIFLSHGDFFSQGATITVFKEETGGTFAEISQNLESLPPSSAGFSQARRLKAPSLDAESGDEGGEQNDTSSEYPPSSLFPLQGRRRKGALPCEVGGKQA